MKLSGISLKFSNFVSFELEKCSLHKNGVEFHQKLNSSVFGMLVHCNMIEVVGQASKTHYPLIYSEILPHFYVKDTFLAQN